MDPDKIFAFLIEKGQWFFPLLAALSAALLFAALRRTRSRRAKWLTGLPLAMFAALMVFGFVFAQKVQAAIDQRTAALTFEPLAGGGRSDLAAYRGQVVVLNYWATWCPPCRAEMPDLDKLAAAYKERGVVVLTLSDEKPEKIEKYRGEHPLPALNFALFKDEAPNDWIARQAYAGRPTTVLIGRDGQVRRLLIGGQSYERFEEALLPLL